MTSSINYVQSVLATHTSSVSRLFSICSTCYRNSDKQAKWTRLTLTNASHTYENYRATKPLRNKTVGWEKRYGVRSPKKEGVWIWDTDMKTYNTPTHGATVREENVQLPLWRGCCNCCCYSDVSQKTRERNLNSLICKHTNQSVLLSPVWVSTFLQHFSIWEPDRPNWLLLLLVTDTAHHLCF